MTSGVMLNTCAVDASRVAPAAPIASWLTERRMNGAAALPPETRDALARAWTRVGLTSHASVARFARFALELLAIGAPSHFVQRTQQAMADEIDHAERAFGLATFYAGAPVGPGPLDLEDALKAPTLEGVLGRVIREGCIGMTLAAAEAEEALLDATDAGVRVVLATVARDKARHAALAWDVVRWAFERGDAAVRALIAEELGSEIDERSAPRTLGLAAPDAALLARHGVLGGAVLAKVRAVTLRDVVEPLARRLTEPLAA
jgi:hypothetical protein